MQSLKQMVSHLLVRSRLQHACRENVLDISARDGYGPLFVDYRKVDPVQKSLGSTVHGFTRTHTLSRRFLKSASKVCGQTGCSIPVVL